MFLTWSSRSCCHTSKISSSLVQRSSVQRHTAAQRSPRDCTEKYTAAERKCVTLHTIGMTKIFQWLPANSYKSLFRYVAIMWMWFVYAERHWGLFATPFLTCKLHSTVWKVGCSTAARAIVRDRVFSDTKSHYPVFTLHHVFTLQERFCLTSARRRSTSFEPSK